MFIVKSTENRLIASFESVKRLNSLIVSDFENHVSKLMSEQHYIITLDLSGISFIDSEGFFSLKKLSEFARQKKTEFQLCNLSDDVLELFNLMKIHNKQNLDNLLLNDYKQTQLYTN